MAPAEPGPQRCVFRTYLKTSSWKSKIKHAVKYCVYWDILLMGGIYVIKSTCLRGNPISGQKTSLRAPPSGGVAWKTWWSSQTCVGNGFTGVLIHISMLLRNWITSALLPIPMDLISDSMFHFKLLGSCCCISLENLPPWHGFADTKEGCVCNSYRDVFLEVQLKHALTYQSVVGHMLLREHV